MGLDRKIMASKLREGSKTDIDYHAQQLLALSLLRVGMSWKSDPHFPGKSPEDLLLSGETEQPQRRNREILLYPKIWSDAILIQK